MDVSHKLLLANSQTLGLEAQPIVNNQSEVASATVDGHDTANNLVVPKASKTKLINDQAHHISILEHQLYTLQTELQLKSSKVSLLVQQQKLSNERIVELNQSIEVLQNQEDQSESQLELEGQITNNNVLKHHCNRLSQKNIELNKALIENRRLLSISKATIEQQGVSCPFPRKVYSKAKNTIYS